MNIYKYIEQETGEILFKKVEIKENEYTIIEKENGDKILRKITNIKITKIE